MEMEIKWGSGGKELGISNAVGSEMYSGGYFLGSRNSSGTEENDRVTIGVTGV
jgi:hypothetical protein